MMKRILSFVLALTMVLTLSMGSGVAFALENEETVVTQELFAEKLDADKIDVNLTAEDVAAADLALEQSLVDENGMVAVFIEMEGDSIIEEDAAAVMDDETQEKVEAMEEVQAQIVEKIEQTVLEGEPMEVSYHYTWLFNGVAATVPYSAMAEIAEVDGVKKVVVQPVYELYESKVTPVRDVSLMTVSDGVMVGRENTWAEGYTGKGIKIAIVDTGLDIDHQNFQPLAEDKLTDDSATAESVAAVLENLNAFNRRKGLSVEDVYYNSKVAYGFNYSDDNLNITHNYDTNGDHGTHVAGIAAANKVDESPVVGVAPDAQLYIMKVFGSQRSGNGADIIAALEDALILGADVVNMSLGSDAGFTSSASETVNEIYERVAQTNTVLSISAGNNDTAGQGNLWGTDANLTCNPDNAVVGEPGAYNNVLSVASVENWKIQRNYIDADGYQVGYTDGGAAYGLPQIMSLTGEYGLVAVPGTGVAEDYAGLDVEGKVALVQRGVTSFVEKCETAESFGAIACIVYNNTSGEFGMDMTDTVATIPCVSITMADGAYLAAAVAENPELTVSFPEDLAAIPTEDGYHMSQFSSWGVAPDLSLEPDITAPGGNIYSTLDGGAYGLMSGTSMAAPNVSGISALVMQYVKENFAEDTDYRTLVQNLLVSTSSPLTFDEESGLFYSPRSQGSGLANAFDAVVSKVYLTVDGTDTPKAELGADPAKSGAYTFTYNVTNFGDAPAYYRTETVVQTEDVMTDEFYGEDTYFMSSTPRALTAATAETGADMVLRYDVDNSTVCWSHDAYLIYRAAIGESEVEGWEKESFRYDTDKDETVSTDDVQAYLDALVGNESEADLDEMIMMVGPTSTTSVTVSVTLSAEDKAFLDTYYPNGGYVEGFTFLKALGGDCVDLSLPFLGFYGDWAAAPVLDNASYWDMYTADYDGESVLGNQYYHVVFTNFYGMPSQTQPGFNHYLEDEVFDPAHIAISPNDDGYLDTIDEIYTSLLRNAATLTYRYSNLETGEVYYEQTVQNVSKSVYDDYYGQIVPNVYTWYEGEIELFGWKDNEGKDFANNTKLLLEVIATGVAEGDEPETWSVPMTVDVEAPVLLSANKVQNMESGETTLELTFKDNHAVAYAGVMSTDGYEIFAETGLVDPEPDAEGYRTYTVSFDVTDADPKVMVRLGDYGINETYYGLNLQGEGVPYGDMVAFQYNELTGVEGWVAFDKDVDCDELTLFPSDVEFVCAEYVNGYIYAQTETGALYGFRYEDMLRDGDLEPIFVAQLQNVYQDLAYSYAEGKLYGLLTYEDAGYPTTEVHSINLKGEYFDENTWMNYTAYQEDWTLGRGGVYGLTLAVDDAGTVYVLGVNYDWDTETVTGNAHLWSVGMEYDQWSDSYMLGYAMTDLGDTGIGMDYLQSMTWDHNAEELVWARFNVEGSSPISELYRITPDSVDENGNILCEKLGDLSGETWALLAPMTAENAAKEEHANLPEMDSTVVGRPVLRDDVVTLNLGSMKALPYDFDPWYTEHREVLWSTSDSNVVSVDENGVITAINSGSATITVANKADESKLDTLEVNVSALDLKFEGIVTAQSAGLGNVTGVSTYEFVMNGGVPSFGTVNSITASEELNYGLSLATSVIGRNGNIFACEYGNTGMIYEIDPATGEVLDAIEPMCGDMLFGMTYSESQDTYAAIMNMFLYVDLELTHEETEDVLASYDEDLHQFTYHRVNMLPYLLAKNDGFVTGETGQGASSEIVFCGITTIEGGDLQDFYSNSGMGSYTPDQTLVLLDNVGRLWYIDEVTGMTKVADEWGNVQYTKENGEYLMTYGEGDIFDMEYGVNEDGSVNCSVFNIRKIAETPLTDMYREGTMPRITYHFSDIEYVGETAEGAPMIAMSLYDYWNNGTTNELYLYIDGVGTGEYTMDENWNYVEIMTPAKMFNLGNTGNHNIIASIHSAEVTGGLEPEQTTEDATTFAVNKLAAGVYGG